MNIFKSRKNLYILAFIVLIFTNLVVLLGVSSNRNSSLTHSITLTERELNIANNISTCISHVEQITENKKVA